MERWHRVEMDYYGMESKKKRTHEPIRVQTVSAVSNKKPRQNLEPTLQLREETSTETPLSAPLTPAQALDRKILQRQENLKAKSNTQLTAAYHQKNLRFINMLIAEFAKKKELRLAKRAWNLVAKCELTPTVYTLTNMVNAYVRCGKMDRAVLLMTECQHFITPNEVTFTALIKGYGESGRVNEAAEWVHRMRESGVEPNLRTYQIILRSAVHWGYLDYAKKWWTELCNQFSPSEPCLEYWIKVLCQAGLANEAWEQLDLAEAKFGLKATATALSDVATASAIAGLFSQARRALLLCRIASSSSSSTHASSETEKTDTSRTNKTNNNKKTRRETPTQQSKNNTSINNNDKDAVFLLNRATEVADACNQTSAYLAGGRRSQYSSFLQCPRVLFLPSKHHLHRQVGNRSAVVGGSSAASKKRNRKKNVSEQADKIQKEKGETAPSDLSSAENVSFEHFFKNKAKTMIEVCSGNGDWVINRALSQPLVNWVAIEVRVDRCYAIFTRMMFQFVPNLLILCGDARAILQHCVIPASVNEVYVNYPEPPGDLENRLLDGRFFGWVARALVPKEGKLIVVSDDAPCIHSILKSLEKSQVLLPLGSSTGLTTSLTSPAETNSEVTLEDYGSSYFDKHWKQRHQLERFMLQWGKDSPFRPELSVDEESKDIRSKPTDQYSTANEGDQNLLEKKVGESEDEGEDEGEEGEGDVPAKVETFSAEGDSGGEEGDEGEVELGQSENVESEDEGDQNEDEEEGDS